MVSYVADRTRAGQRRSHREVRDHRRQRATGQRDTISGNESPPSLGVVAVKTATIAMDNYSFETVEVMKELRDMRERAQRNIAACRQRLAACPNAPPLPGLAADIDP